MQFVEKKQSFHTVGRTSEEALLTNLENGCRLVSATLDADLKTLQLNGI